MNTIDFNRKCRPFLKQYRDLFSVVPCINDYSCTQDEFFEALQKATEEKKPLENYIKKAAAPRPDVLY